MYGRSSMNIDPRIPTMPERSNTSGFHRSGRHCLHQALRSAVSCSASRMKGELHPTKNRVMRGEGWEVIVLICCVVWPGVRCGGVRGVVIRGGVM